MVGKLELASISLIFRLGWFRCNPRSGRLLIRILDGAPYSVALVLFWHACVACRFRVVSILDAASVWGRMHREKVLLVRCQGRLATAISAHSIMAMHFHALVGQHCTHVSTLFDGFFGSPPIGQPQSWPFISCNCL